MPLITTVVTEIPYRYRDANNYKHGTTLILDGAISPEQITQLRSDLDEGYYFIPTQVNLRHLGEAMENFPGEADHAWHELDTEDVRVLTRQVHTDDVQDLTGFLTAMTAAATAGWDDHQAAVDLDIPVNV